MLRIWIVFIALFSFMQAQAESFQPHATKAKRLVVNGTIADLAQADDNQFMTLQKELDNKGSFLIIDFENIRTEPQGTLSLSTQYSNDSQAVVVKAYNNSSKSWVKLSKMKSASVGSFVKTDLNIDNLDQLLDAGDMRLKLILPKKNNTESIYLDQVNLMLEDKEEPNHSGKQTYEELATAITRNPERGTAQALNFNGDFIEDIWLDKTGKSLLQIQVFLTPFREGDISEAFLLEYDKVFNFARENGLKIVLRHTYNAKIGDEDAALPIVLNHITQLSPYWQKNKDVLLTLQAGFVGSWGEWHSSTNELTKPENAKSIIDTLLEQLPTERTVQIRKPIFKQQIFERTTPISSEEAFTGTPYARLGHHNDCVIGDETDAGTYVDSDNYDINDVEKYKQYVAEDTLYTPNGGETCKNKKTYTSCTNALTDFKRIHFSYLSHEFFIRSILRRWKAEGCYDEIVRDLGYRLVMNSLELTPSVQKGQTLAINMQLDNKGYAPLFNARPVNLVLKNAEHTEILTLDIDPRRWTPGSHEVATVVTLPENMPTGDYDVYLELPDNDETLRSDPRYAVQLSNIGLWDADTGLNNMKIRIQVTDVLTPTL